MIRCRWCGMESRDVRVCEWCKRVLTTGQPAPAEHQAPPSDSISSANEPTTAMPPSVSASVPSDSPTAATTPPASAGAPVSASTDTVSGQVRILYEIYEGLPFHLRLERFLAVVLPLAAINVLVLSQRPEWALWSNFVYFFVFGLWMTASHLISTIDDVEDYRDVSLVMLFSLFCCGPIGTLIIYSLASAILALILKTDMNWSLMGLLGGYLLARILFDMVLILIDFEDIRDFVRIELSFTNFVLLTALFGGWLVGGMVRHD